MTREGGGEGGAVVVGEMGEYLTGERAAEKRSHETDMAKNRGIVGVVKRLGIKTLRKVLLVE